MNPWDNWDLETELRRLSGHIAIIDGLTRRITESELDPELISLCCERVCIAICASLEQGLKKIFMDRALSHAGNPNHWVIKLTKTSLDRMRNPGIPQINGLVKVFVPDFERGLGEDSPIGEMVRYRHSIAHDKGEHGNITKRQLEDYLQAYENFLRNLNSISH